MWFEWRWLDSEQIWSDLTLEYFWMFNVNLQQTDPVFEGHEVGSATTSPTPTPPTKASMSSAKVVQVARNFLCACGARQGLEIRVGGKHLDKSMPCRGKFKYPSRTIVIWDLLFHAQSSLFQSTNLAGLFSLSHASVGMVLNHSDYYDFMILINRFFQRKHMWWQSSLFTDWVDVHTLAFFAMSAK